MNVNTRAKSVANKLPFVRQVYRSLTSSLRSERDQATAERDQATAERDQLIAEQKRMAADEELEKVEMQQLIADRGAALDALNYVQWRVPVAPDGYRFELQPITELPLPSPAMASNYPLANYSRLEVCPEKLRSMPELLELLQNLGPAGLELEARIFADNHEAHHFEMYGYCEVCNRICTFSADWNPGQLPNYRESLWCSTCNMWSRARKTFGYLKTAKRPDQLDIYLYEQVTALFKQARAIFSDANVVGSEYVGDNIPSGTVIDGIRHEDALKLSFVDESFDFMVSCDVFEHVPDIDRTLSEAYRVLRKGGQLIVTIPFFRGNTTTVQRAAIIDGELRHFLPPEYHLNPMSAEGSLVFYEHGWDFLDRCRTAGFKDVYILPYYSYWCGYLGEGLQYMFIAEK